MQIHDDGVGFDRKTVAEQGRGLGITTMSERIALLKGTYQIESAPEAGTTVSLWVPWEPPNSVNEPMNRGEAHGTLA
jgi:signal transduction histidine kinase